MPEGPEVFSLKKSLTKKYKNATLYNITILSGRYTRHGLPDGMNNFKKKLPIKIKSFNNIGKFFWIETNSKWTIWITFGLTGWLCITDRPKDTRIEFNTSKGNIYMIDPRNFGTISFCDNPDYLDKKINTLGIDPLNEKVSYNEFATRILHYGSDKILADALLDQRIVAGIGNYVRSEVIYRAKINPFIKVKKLTKKQIEILLKSIKYILKKFLNPNVDFEVYRQANSPDGRPVKVKETPKGRSFYYV